MKKITIVWILMIILAWGCSQEKPVEKTSDRSKRERRTKGRSRCGKSRN